MVINVGILANDTHNGYGGAWTNAECSRVGKEGDVDESKRAKAGPRENKQEKWRISAVRDETFTLVDDLSEGKNITF